MLELVFFFLLLFPYLILQRNNDSLKKNECIEMNTITLRRTKFLLCKPIKHKFPITYITMMYTSGLTFFAKKKQYWHWIYIWEQKHLVGIFWAALWVVKKMRIIIRANQRLMVYSFSNDIRNVLLSKYKLRMFCFKVYWTYKSYYPYKGWIRGV